MQLLGARRDWVAVLAALIAPLGVTVALVPFQANFNNTAAAFLLVAVVVAATATA